MKKDIKSNVQSIYGLLVHHSKKKKKKKKKPHINTLFLINDSLRNY